MYIFLNTMAHQTKLSLVFFNHIVEKIDHPTKWDQTETCPKQKIWLALEFLSYTGLTVFVSLLHLRLVYTGSTVLKSIFCRLYFILDKHVNLLFQVVFIYRVEKLRAEFNSTLCDSSRNCVDTIQHAHSWYFPLRSEEN